MKTIKISIFLLIILLLFVSCKAELRIDKRGYVQGPKLEGALEIPSEVKGKTVVGISKLGFSPYSTYEEYAYSKDVKRESKITSITLPQTITEIEEYSFLGASIESIVIPAGVSVINSGTFKDCESLSEVILPDGLKRIGYDAFEGCKSLKTIVIPNSVKEISSDAFKDCESLSEVILPEGLEKIESGTFEGCKSLKTIVIPNSIKEIGFKALKDCESLSEISLPEGLKEIDSSAFAGCKSLKTIIIPYSVAEIGEEAFKGCGLETIVLPYTLRRLGKNALSKCSHLGRIIYDGSESRWEELRPSELTSGNYSVQTTDGIVEYELIHQTYSTSNLPVLLVTSGCQHDWFPIENRPSGANSITWYQCTKCGEVSRVVRPNI